MMVGGFWRGCQASLMRSDNATWSPTLTELVQKGTVDVRHYDLELNYDFWKYGRRHLALF